VDARCSRVVKGQPRSGQVEALASLHTTRIVRSGAALVILAGDVGLDREDVRGRRQRAVRG